MYQRHGVIPRRAIDKFLNRERRDCSRWKSFSDNKLLDLMEGLPIRPPIWNALRKHQRVCFLLAAKFRHFAYINDTGTGKTLLGIATARYFKKLSETRTLVLVPNIPNKDEWRRECKKHSPSTKCIVLEGSTEDKWQLLDDNPDGDVFVETFGGFIRMLTTKKKDTRKNKSKKERLVPNAARVKRACNFFRGVIVDEVNFAKNPEKLAYRLLRQLRKAADFFITLSGTPFGRDPSDLWAQFNLVDNGYTLGETLGLFRAAFFRRIEKPWGAVEYKFDRTLENELHRILGDCSIRYEADAASLPSCVPIEKFVELAEDAEVIYQRAHEQLVAARGDKQQQKNTFLRLRQISSGFVGFKGDEDGEKVEHVFEHNPKLDALLDFVAGVPKHEKVLIFHEFIYSGRRIAEELQRMGIRFAQINGQTSDSVREREKFETDPKCQVLVLGATGRYGLNLQVARYGIFYESPVSAIVRRQSEKRVHRQESKHKTVFLVDLLTRDTVDENIRRFHLEGGNMFAAIVDGRRTGRRGRLLAA